MRRKSPPVMMEMKPRELAAWRKKFPPSTYRPGQVLFYRGHFPYGVLIIYSGTADLRTRESDPRSPIRVGPNMLLGLSYVLRGEPYPLTAVVTEELEASFIERTLIADWARNRELPFTLPA